MENGGIQRLHVAAGARARALVVPEAEPPPPVHLVDLPDELLERICAAAACGAPANAGVLPRTLQLTELSEEADVDPCRFSAASFARLAR